MNIAEALIKEFNNPDITNEISVYSLLGDRGYLSTAVINANYLYQLNLLFKNSPII